MGLKRTFIGASNALADLAALGMGTKQVARLTAPATAQHLKVVGLGDSVASLKMRWMYASLNRAFGGGAPGVSVSPGQSGTAWSLPGVTANSTTGTITAATTDFDAWFSGASERYATGGSRTYGIGGVSTYWDTAKVYYVKGPSSPDGGTFKIQVDGVDETGFTSVSASDASISLGIATITKGSVAQRSLGVVNLTGAHRIIGVGFSRSDHGGAIYAGISQGGISLADAVSTAGARNNLVTYLVDFAPDLITLECKENSSYYATALATLLPLLRAAAPTATIVGIGSTPLATGDADQVVQNAQLRAACVAADCTYWDGYTPVVNYATLNALGWAGDGTHVDDKASAYLGGLLLNDLAILAHPGMTSGRDVDASNGRVRGRLDLGDPRADGAALSNGALTTAGGAGFDVDLLLRRALRVLSTTGVPDVSSWLIQPGNASDQQIPNGIRIGTAGPFLRSLNASLLGVYSARGGGSSVDVSVRSVVMAFQTLSSQSGAVTIDLSAGAAALVNLVGNVTSLAFSNPSSNGAEVEIHFIQDATGGRTLAGVAAAIKLAGGALVLTTTAGRRDILKFRLSSGSYYEISRSMGVTA